MYKLSVHLKNNTLFFEIEIFITNSAMIIGDQSIALTCLLTVQRINHFCE